MFRLCNILLALLLFSGPVSAQELKPIEFNGIYDIALGQLRFARLGIEISQSETSYQVTCDVAITGLLKLFTQHESHTTVSGSGAAFEYPSRVYESHYRTKKKPRHVKMVYRAGEPVEEVVTPADNPATRPPPTSSEKKGSYDPLSLLLRMRKEMAQARAKPEGHEFSINAYDGRRLTRAIFTTAGTGTLTYNEKPVRVFKASLRRELLAGFTEKERKKHDPNEPPVTVYFSADERLMPLKLETDFWLGKLSATLAKECRTGESCLLGVK